MSPPILIVDLDGDGIDIISLENSSTYFDIDGDGLAERTSRVTSEEAFLLALSQEEVRTVSTVEGNLHALMKRKSNRFYEENGDAIVVAKDRDLDGIPETKRSQMVSCGVVEVDIHRETSFVITCSGGDTYRVQEVRFAYKDDNVQWEALCATLRALSDARSKSEYEPKRTHVSAHIYGKD